MSLAKRTLTGAQGEPKPESGLGAAVRCGSHRNTYNLSWFMSELYLRQKELPWRTTMLYRQTQIEISHYHAILIIRPHLESQPIVRWLHGLRYLRGGVATD